MARVVGGQTEIQIRKGKREALKTKGTPRRVLQETLLWGINYLFVNAVSLHTKPALDCKFPELFPYRDLRQNYQFIPIPVQMRIPRKPKQPCTVVAVNQPQDRLHC